MIDVRYVVVEGPTGEEEAWAVAVNGHLVATDSDNDALTCGEVAENLASVLGVPLQEARIRIDKWDWVWEKDVLPAAGAPPEEPKVVLSVQEDLEDLVRCAASGDRMLSEKVRAAIREGRVTPEVIRRAAEIARDAILSDGYWDYLTAALEEVLEE